MRTSFLILFFSILFFACSYNNRGSFVIDDFSRDTTILAKTNSHSPTTLWLYIKGSTNDTIIINDVKWKVNAGKIDSLQLDHYTPELAIKIEHYKATSGKIEVDYYVP
ncbi:hypothetical protein ACP3T3_20265 [Chryseobacterium sp. CBSDS_008]|uniref:hypothetical protein n=1 Tax=Chryseobacterium sp. CBSDS_008 TaxID=3415265 RepID=UPI003CF71953